MPRTLRESPTLLSAPASLSLLRSGHTRHDHLAAAACQIKCHLGRVPERASMTPRCCASSLSSAGGQIAAQDPSGDTTKAQRR